MMYQSSKVRGSGELVNQILATAKAKGIETAQALARLAGVAPETLSRMRKRRTADFDTVVRLAAAAGLELTLAPATQSSEAGGAADSGKSKSAALGLQFPYDWSNPGIDDEILIARVIEANRFADLARVCRHFGIDRVQQVAEKYRLADLPGVIRSMANIRAGAARRAAA